MPFEFQICSIEHMKNFMNSRDLFLDLKNVVSQEYKSADEKKLQVSVSDKKLQVQF